MAAELQKSLKASSLFSVSLLLLVLLWLRPSMAATRTVPGGVILDLNSKLGEMVRNSLILAIGNYYSVHNDTPTRINLIVRNISQDDVAAAADAASDLMEKDKVRAILGPQNSEQAKYIVKLAEESQVPVIWFPMTGPSLLPPPSPSSIYSDQGLTCFQFHAIADIINAFG